PAADRGCTGEAQPAQRAQQRLTNQAGSNRGAALGGRLSSCALSSLFSMFTGIVQERGRVASFDDGRLVVESGIRAGIGDSVAVDGVSLTVAELDDDGFAVALVQHTLEVTTLGSLAAGATVNLETDVLAKCVERLLRSER